MGNDGLIRITVPQIDEAIALSLKARGCSFKGDTITFPPGTQKDWKRGLGIVTTISEFYSITLPDGYVLTEKRDRMRGYSQLLVPLDVRTEGIRIQEQLDTIRDLARLGSVFGELPDGRTVVIKQTPECWTVRVYQGGSLVISWEGKSIDTALCIGAYRHQVKLFDVKTWTPVA